MRPGKNFHGILNSPGYHIYSSTVIKCDFSLPYSKPPLYLPATLILNCLSFCCACIIKRSTAYANLSFFAIICFNLSASLPPSLARCLPFESPAPDPLSSPWDRRPSSRSHRAIRACSRRSSLSRCVSTRESSEAISGVRDARREACAVERVEVGRSSKC